MKFLLILFAITIATCSYAQSKNIDYSKYKLVGAVFVDSTSPTFPYVRWNGHKLVDIRSMTKKDAELLYQYDRINDIQRDGRFPNAYWSFLSYGSSIQIGYPSGIKDTLFHGGDGEMSTIVQAQIPVEFAAVNITPQNADQYLYHIIENGQKEIVHWQKPTIFITTKDGKYQYAYLGKFDPGIEKQLKVEVYNINNYKDKTECNIDWRKIKPFSYSDIFIMYTTKRNPTIYTSILNSLTSHKNDLFIETAAANDYRVRMGDSLINMELHNRYKAPYFYYIEVQKESKKIFMDVFKGDTKLLYNIWNTPGKYTVTITPRIPTRYWAGQKPNQNGRDVVMHQYTTRFSFTVLPPLHQKISFSKTQIITFFIGLALFIFFIWWYVRQKAKVKIIQANFQKEKNVLELSSLRNQLNPHFILNAITSIQNLILKNENTAANTYLTKLGRITRNILDNSYQELISIDGEIKLLTEYLEMEQLRFGFQYAINKEDDLDKEVEIPAMLLQPLVENAIKHGISTKKDMGKIDIIFTKKAIDIYLQIIDNGGNVQNFSNPNGHGINLVRKRISLINQENKAKTIEINFTSNTSETIACITLHQWI